MRQIQPVTLWNKGQRQANYLDVRSIYDDLSTKATFRYYLISIIEVVDEEGGITYINEILSHDEEEMNGLDYQNWGASTDINNEAYVWVANKVGLILI